MCTQDLLLRQSEHWRHGGGPPSVLLGPAPGLWSGSLPWLFWVVHVARVRCFLLIFVQTLPCPCATVPSSPATSLWSAGTRAQGHATTASALLALLLFLGTAGTEKESACLRGACCLFVFVWAMETCPRQVVLLCALLSCSISGVEISCVRAPARVLSPQ